MIITDIIRAALIVVVPFTPNLGAVYAIAFVLEAMSLIFLPARDSVVPNLVSPSKLTGANGLIMLAQWGTIPLAGGLVVAADAGSGALVNIPIIGFLARQRGALPFFFDAVTFLVSAWAITKLPAAVGRVTRSATESLEEGGLHALEKDMVKGVRYLLADRGRRDLIIGMALATGAGGGLFSIGIPYVKTTLRASDSVFGALVALWGVGMAIGAYITQRSPRRESELFRLGLGASGAILIFMAVVSSAWLAVVVAIGFGAGLSMAMVLGITIAQRTAPDELRGRVMSAIHVLSRVFLILGSVVVGGVAAAMDRIHLRFLPDWDGNRYAFLLAGVVLVAGGAAARTGAVILEGSGQKETAPDEAERAS